MENAKTIPSKRSPFGFIKRSLAVVAFTLVLGLCTILIAPGWVQANLPVIDVTAITQMIEQSFQMADQLDKLVQQVGLLKQQIQSLTGNYGMGAVGGNVNGWGANTWTDIINMVGQGINPGDAAQVQAFKQAQAKYSSQFPALSNNLQPGNPRMNATYNQSYSDAMAGTALGESTFDQINATLLNIQTLKDQIDHTDNVKSAMDLNAAITVQLAQLNSEMLRVQSAQLKLQASTKSESTNGAAAQAEFFDQ